MFFTSILQTANGVRSRSSPAKWPSKDAKGLGFVLYGIIVGVAIGVVIEGNGSAG